MPVANFSRIMIIQSLFPNDEFTGTKLHEDIEVLNVFHGLGLDVELVNVENRHELMEAFRKIEEKTKENEGYPLLHLEIHGSDDATGIVLSSGDYISWEELKEPLTRINVACRLNLIIILAVCHGAQLTKIVQPVDRAPCWGLIGPTEEIESGFVLKSFYDFYKILLEKGSGGKALRALKQASEQSSLKGVYHFTNAEYFFKKVYMRYVQEECSSKGLSKSAKRMYRKLKNEKGSSIRSVGQLKRHLKRTQEENFYKYASNYFMCDLYDENKSRFKVEYKDVIG